MNTKTIRIIYGVVILIIIAFWWYGKNIIEDNQPRPSGLGYWGADTFHANEYRVKEFEFYNQDSQPVTRKNFDNKVWVTDFFFTTCEGICPVMSSNLAIIQDSFRKDTNVKILSHTVDPNTDNVSVLKQYAIRHQAASGQWHFVTGKSEAIYDLARTSYFVATPKDSSLAEDFVHSQLICLVDPHNHIRGYYDGTNGKDMKKLIVDIKKLLAEYDIDGRRKTKIIFPFLDKN